MVNKAHSKFYKVLDLNENSTLEEVKKRYRELA